MYCARFCTLFFSLLVNYLIEQNGKLLATYMMASMQKFLKTTNCCYILSTYVCVCESVWKVLKGHSRLLKVELFQSRACEVKEEGNLLSFLRNILMFYRENRFIVVLTVLYC